MDKIIPTVKLQITLLFYAISYFTRIPIPAAIGFDAQQFHKANAYFPLIGAAIAVFMFAVFYLSQLLFSDNISLILMLAGALLVTGALHEDGFADFCDGFGGGYNVTQRLKIMKDSQIGTYAGIGLIVLFLLKYNLLLELTSISYSTLFVTLILAHTLSRYAALCLMQTLPYVRLDDASKLQSLATKLEKPYFIFASLCACSCLLLLNLSSAITVVSAIIIISFIIAKQLSKDIQGYTGDCLGFTQQCIELTVLSVLTVLLTK